MRGRKPNHESRAAEIRMKLAARKQRTKSTRPSLRGLSRELGVSHQLLRFYLDNMDRWQKGECSRQAEQIRKCAQAENREMTPVEEAHVIALKKESFQHMIQCSFRDILKDHLRNAKKGELVPEKMGVGQFKAMKKLVEMGVKQNIPQAQKILRILTGYDYKAARRQKVAAAKRAETARRLNLLQRQFDSFDRFGLTDKEKAPWLREIEKLERAIGKELARGSQNNLPRSLPH